MYNAYELMPNLRRKTFGPFDTVADAIEFIEDKIGEITVCEEDEEHDDHYDAFTKTMRVISIEPVA